MFEKFPQLDNTPETQEKTEGLSYAKKVAAVAETPAIKEQINDLGKEVEGKKLKGPDLVAAIAKIIAKTKSQAEQTK